MLLLQIQRIDQFLIRLRLVHLQIREKLPAVCDVGKQPATRGVVLLVLLQVLRHLIDLLREQCHLHLRRAGILLMRAVLGDDFLLGGTLESHNQGGKHSRNKSSGLSVSSARRESASADEGYSWTEKCQELMTEAGIFGELTKCI